MKYSVKKYLTYLAALFFLMNCKGVDRDLDGSSRPFSHEVFDGLLSKYVDDRGMVDYQGFVADSLSLNKYLKKVSTNPPNQNYWSENEELAYWINAYNAFTIQLVIRNYPVKSIKDIGTGVKIPFVNSPWDIKFIPIGKNLYDLNNIEHGTIRKVFDEPRIHFALVCAAISCPRLLNEAYVAEKLNEQLEVQARYFINNSEKNVITEEHMKLSKLFSWYKGDFTEELDLIEFIDQYVEVEISKTATIEHLDYIWSLNERK